jgi:hypothetical protein
MPDATTLVVERNDIRNAVIRFSDVSDATGLVNFKIFDATASGPFGVNQAGQIFYPGPNVSIWGLDYDVQDMKITVAWEATINQALFVLGSAPEDFKWKDTPIKCPKATLAGVTGSLLVSTVAALANSTCWMRLYLRKNVPQF